MRAALVSIGLLAPLCLVLLTGQARVYRCVDPATDAIRFSDIACQAQEQGTESIVRPNSINTQGAREQALRYEIRQLKDQLQEQERRNDSAQPVRGMTQPDLQAERIDARACEQARRSYEVESGSISRNQARLNMKREAMYGACGMREPDRTEINIKNNHYDDNGRRNVGGPSIITNCDSSGCWDTQGGRYHRGAGNTYFGPSGAACQRTGSQMNCP